VGCICGGTVFEWCFVASNLIAVQIVKSRDLKTRDSACKTTNLVWSTMNSKTFKIRYRVSLGLYVLGFAVPFFVGIGFMVHNYAYFGSLILVFPVWLPITVLLWLVSAYVAPITKYRKIGWAGFILGLLMSVVWGYFIVLAMSQYR
jgi:hypothetical protein